MSICAQKHGTIIPALFTVFITGVYDMKIKVDAEKIINVIAAVKQLPVKGDFDAADSWVGIVLTLEQLLQAEEVEE